MKIPKPTEPEPGSWEDLVHKDEIYGPDGIEVAPKSKVVAVYERATLNYYPNHYDFSEMVELSCGHRFRDYDYRNDEIPCKHCKIDEKAAGLLKKKHKEC